MITFNTGKCDILFVPCNEDATDPTMGNHCIGWKSNQDWQNIDSNGWRFTKLGLMAGKNNYEVIGFTDELTESRCRCLVEDVGIWVSLYRNYEKEEPYFDTAKESLRSLLTANHITGRQIVLRKIEYK